MKNSDKPEQPVCDQMVDLLPDPFIVIDRNYRIVAANQKYLDHYGVTKQDIKGRCCHEVSHHSTVPCHENGEDCPLLDVFAKKKTTQVVHIHHDKHGEEERVQLHASPIFDEKGKVAYMGEAVIPLSNNDETTPMLIGRSPVMLKLVSLLQRVSPTNATVLLQGESGVGKERAAEYIHHYSRRHSGPFIVIDCGVLGESIVERELFGHEKGSFTGAMTRKPGLFEAASGGTLFIDEVSELPLALQTKLLRVLETGKYRRIGGTAYLNADVRVICATNRPLQKLVETGEFRSDLYYRLSAFPVEVPPLREHKDDIPALAESFLLKMEDGARHVPLTANIIENLLGYSYPGNVRELRNVLERANILADSEPIQQEHLRFEFLHAENSTPERNTVLKNGAANKPDHQTIMKTLQSCNGNRAQTARELGITERTIYRHLQQDKVS